ncbi:MAG TPA: T9SS type A sorting domain-containing protein [Chitinophagaceae bacterium]|nr:T9SS type A sorting domain-containing protein [Chitinophagaceae bacterium]MCC6635762.1 T9SS type A sorting domain-containing protein [Chitinophagaceae bacterium]HMZ45324.1 T9SS type A sorting domain-containing protein [Chitinophagaceae bacterium]HNF30369.1 T9SS type A sorting domain-containing protein [Chitinophagaceae bacterium]HNM35048.1 T9SS type A sorting domain-containing protein [Chitinophagaceae bacterium]
MKSIKTYLVLIVIHLAIKQAHSQLYVSSGANITIQDGAKITLQSTNLINNSNITGAGKLILSGNSPAQISGIGNIDNLAIDNTAGISIASIVDTVRIIQSLTPMSGTFTVNGNLVLVSNAVGTARIAAGTGSYINGNITVERYIPAKATRKWSFISSPVTGTINNTWQQLIHITGSGTGGTVCPFLTAHSNGFDATVSNAANIFTYDASKTINTRWEVPSGTLLNTVGMGKGFRVNVRGYRSIGCNLINGNPAYLSPTSVTLRATGAISNTDKNLGSFSIVYPNNGINNYVFIGNPYPSPISFNAFKTTNSSSITNTYAIYIPASPSGVYSYWDGVSFTGGTGYNNATGNIIASGQAFFVQSSVAGNLNLTFDEAHKTDGSDVGYFRTRNFNDKIRVHYLMQDNTQLDEIIVRYAMDAAINNTDENEWDIPSINSGSHYLTSFKGYKGMVVQTRNSNTLASDTVRLNVVCNQSGIYKLGFTEFEHFIGTDIFLIDHLQQSIHNVKQLPVYEFTVDKDKPETKGAGRFSVVFNKLLQNNIVNYSIKMYPNPTSKMVTIELPDNSNYVINIKDITGKIVLQKNTTGGANQFNISKLTSGTYLVEVTDRKRNRATEKLLVEH